MYVSARPRPMPRQGRRHGTTGGVERYRPSRLPLAVKMFQELRSSSHKPFGPQPCGFTGLPDCR